MPFSNTHTIPRITYGHHLAPDSCWIFNNKAIINIGKITSDIITPSGVFDVTPLGEVLAHTSITHFEALGKCDPLLTTQEITIILKYRKRDTTNRNSVAFGINPESGAFSERCTTLIPWSDSIVYWDFGGFAEGSTRLSVSGLSFGSDLWVFNTGPRGMEIWQNGIKRASNSSNPTRTTNSTRDFCIGRGSDTDSDLSDYALLYIYKRQLTESEILEITQNPYIFLSDNSYIYDKLDLFAPTNYFPNSLSVNWSVVAPVISVSQFIAPNPLTSTWSVITPSIQLRFNQTVTPTALAPVWSLTTPTILNDTSTLATYPTNLLVLDRSVINSSMIEKDTSQQTMYSLSIPANKLNRNSKLRVTATLARNKGILKTNRLKCSYTNPQAVIGITKEDEPFYTGPFYNSSVNANDPDSLITDFLVTSAIDNVAIAGVCYVRMCCPPFRNRVDQAVYAATGVFQNNSPNGVFGSGVDYGPTCAYQDSWVRFENILEGVPKIALLLHIKPGSTVQNMTAYGAVYDSGTNKLSIRMWKNQSLLDDEGHIFAESNYTMQPGDYLGFIVDMSDNYVDPPQYPYIMLEVYIFNNSTAGIRLYWERDNPTISGWNLGPLNTPWDNLIHPQSDSYAGMAALGVDNSTSCISRSQWSDFEASCGLCYVASGWQDFPFDIDWSCNDRVWYEFP